MGETIMAINTANKNGTTNEEAIFSPAITITKAANTMRNLAMGA
jgi:hypothetical protein